MTQEPAPIQPETAVDAPSAQSPKPLQRRALAFAARALRRCVRTLRRWMRNPAFRRCLEGVLVSRGMTSEAQALHCAGEALSALHKAADGKRPSKMS